MSEEKETKQIHSNGNNDSVTLPEVQYEDMKKTIRSLTSQLKESETMCFLVKQVQMYNH